MSTANPAAAPETPALVKEIRRPLLWLLAIVVLGFGLRARHLKEPFQLDEFTTLAAVAERSGVEVGVTPTAADPLIPVASLGEVSRRSVIPFGFQDPVPLYHDILWAVIHVLPPADWSLRLPSVLAGTACIVLIFFLLRRPLGNEMALVAALFVALEPIQIVSSWEARPMALGNMFVVLSFAALWGLLHASRMSWSVLLALAYGLCIAIIGYLNPLMLLVIAAHIGVVLYALRGETAAVARKAALFAVAGLALGLLLLVPQYGYFAKVASFAYNHSQPHADGTAAYLTAVNDIHLFTPLWTLIQHNLVLLAGLVLVLAAAAVIRMQLQGGGTEPKVEGEAPPPVGDDHGGGIATAVTTAPAAAPATAPAASETVPEPAAPLPENEAAMRLARLWIFAPQAALLLAALLVPAIFYSRFLTYTTLGAAIVLAYYATRDGSREVRLGVSGVLALALLLVGFWPSLCTGSGMFSSTYALSILGSPDKSGGLTGTDMNKSTPEDKDKGIPEKPALWRRGDVVLMRSGLVESDFLNSEEFKSREDYATIRPQVERVLVAPLTLLYPDSSSKPVIALPLSNYRNTKARTSAGDPAMTAEFFDADLAARLKKYQRFWMTGVTRTPYPNSPTYLACVVPWLAKNLDRGTLVLSRSREGQDHYVRVEPGLGLEEPIKGLTEDFQLKDYDNPLHIVRRPPQAQKPEKSKSDTQKSDASKSEKPKSDTSKSEKPKSDTQKSDKPN
jgi:hypothetical protein